AMQQALLHPDPQIRNMALAFLQQADDNDQSPLSTRVHRVVRRLLPTGECTIKAIADSFNMNRRTLQRRLDAEGTEFSEIMETARQELAKHYLLGGGLPLAQITGLLGYTEQSAFQRAFRRWFGTTPGR